MRTRKLILIVAILLCINMLGCGPAVSFEKPGLQELKALKTIAVRVNGEPKFTHIESSTSESVGLVMLTGLVGSIVDSSSRNNKDAKIAEAIKPEEILSKANHDFANTLVKALQESRRFDKVKYVDSNSNDFDAVLDIKVVQWGSRIKQSDSKVIIPFMKVRISMTTLSGNKSIWDETQTITYDSHHTEYDYKMQNELFKNDFQSLINKSGKRVADLLLDFYRV